MSAGGRRSDNDFGVHQSDDPYSSLEFGTEEFVAHSDPSREAQLADVIARTIIPSLLQQNKALIAIGSHSLHPDQSHIDRLTTLIIGPDNADALEYIYSLRGLGISLDDLHLELLEPTARHLGELWNKDEIDFFAVTMAVNRLQRIVHHFADLDKIEPYDEKRRALMVVAPGDDHNFGNQIVQKFLKAAGWSVVTEIGSDPQRILDIVSKEWHAIVGFSISGSAHIHALSSMIKKIRGVSRNRHIGVMIGGAMITNRPELVEEMGADGTADNAASAVILAKKLLARGLQAEVDQET